MSKVDVTVRVDKEHAGELDTVVTELTKAGLSGVVCRTRFLMVQGACEQGALDTLRRIRGVASVREDETYRALGDEAPRQR